jgi:muramoyltetrapeptide carboxypeptidase
MSLTGLKVLNNGKTDGVLLGGCLSLITSQLGTPYMPSFKGSILFIEDVGESSYKIDRYLAQLKQADILNSISGAILGEFIDCDPEQDDNKSFKVLNILHEYFDPLDIPVVCDFPYGHGMKKVTMPIGVHTIMDTQNGLLSFTNPFMPRSA